MANRRLIRVVPALGLVASFAFAHFSLAFGQPLTSRIERILTIADVWGRDFPTLLAELRALREAGEQRVYVFADRAAGATAFKTASDAQSRVARVNTLLARPAVLQPPFVELQRQLSAQGAPLRGETLRLRDGDGFHVVLTRPAGLQLLATGLTIQLVRDRVGAPDSVTQLTIQNEGERKPVILTLHNYAGSAIAFAESNMTEPGVVERVVMDLNAIVPVVSR